MALDAVTLIENLASGIFTAGLDLLFSWSEMIGFFGLIALLTRQRSSRNPLSPGKFAIGLFFCAALVSLPSIINASGAQLGFGATSFDAIAYVQPATYGVAAGAANAVLSLVRLAGVGFVYAALDMFRRSELEGHTALSSSESIRAATVKLFAGTGMVFSPQLIDAALATLGLSF